MFIATNLTGIFGIPASFNMFKLGNNNDANDYQKEPRTDLTETNQLPGMVLVRIFPSIKKCSYIFG